MLYYISLEVWSGFATIITAIALQYNFSLVNTVQSHILPTDSCPCSATGDLFAEMCETRTPSGPCVCRSSTDCMVCCTLSRDQST